MGCVRQLLLMFRLVGWLVCIVSQGISAARQIFKRGRTSEQCSPELFIASGEAVRCP